MEALPGAALEVVETEFFFQLLVSLLANPSRLDGGSQGAQLGLRRQVGEMVFLLSRHPVFADEPSLLPGQMLLTLVPNPLRWSVGDPHANSSKTSLELSFRAGAPTDGVPFGMSHRNTDLGILRCSKSAKVVLGRVLIKRALAECPLLGLSGRGR